MKLGLSLAALATLQLAAGLAIQLAVLAALGAGAQTDTWVAAQAVPLVLFSTVSVAMQGAWQSRLAVASARLESWRRAQQAAQGQGLLVFGAASLALAAAAPLWVSWLFPGFSDEQHRLTVRMTYLLMLGALLNGQTLLLTTALRARERFVVAEVVALIGSLAAIGGIALTVGRFGVEAAAWISVARSTSVYAVLFLIAGRPLPEPRLAWNDRDAWRQARPLLIGSSLYKTGPLVDRFWTSLGPAGSMTTFHLVQTAMSALASVVERAVCIPVIPRLARLAADGDLPALRSAYRRGVLKVSFAAAAVLAALLTLWPWWPALAGPVLKLDVDGLTRSWWLCVLLVGYLHPAAAGSVVVGSFYALGDTATPVRVGVAGFAVSLLLKAAGFLGFGLIGLAVATAAHYLANFAALCWLLERRLARRSKS